MKHEKEFQRDGFRLKIEVDLHIDSWRSVAIWNVEVYKKERGKRKWLSVGKETPYRYGCKPSLVDKEIKDDWREMAKQTRDELLEKIKNDVTTPDCFQNKIYD